MWLPYDILYEVSHEGQVRHIPTGNIPKGTMDKDGYIIMTLYKSKKVRRARMIASVFCPRIIQERAEVDHINGIVYDDRPCNLRWADKSTQGINKPAEHISIKNTKSGYRYEVQFTKNKKHIYRKIFKTLEEAMQARDMFQNSDLYMSIVGFIPSR